MSDAEDVKFTLNFVINKQKTKILFAEADSEFTDVLLSFLTLPLGKIVRVMEKHYGDEAPVFGSLTTLYKGLSNLDTAHFWIDGCKQMLLNPIISFETERSSRKLKLSIHGDTQPIKYFTCESMRCTRRESNIGLYYGTGICSCGKTLNTEISVKNVSLAADNGDNDAGAFCIKKASFIIADDLRVVPNVAESVMETLSNIGVTDTLGAEIMDVTIGPDDIMNLLKGLFLSGTSLTDTILNRSQTVDTVKPDSEPKALLLHQAKKEANSDRLKKMSLKLMVQKSTNKLLFAQAKEDFVDFLFSLLIIPLGGVGSLLDGNTCIKSVDNFYKSIVNIDGNKYLKNVDTKSLLLKPKLPRGYISKPHVLPLTEEQSPLLYYFHDKYIGYLSHSGHMRAYGPGVRVSSYMSPGGEGNYVKGPIMYMVTDDLTVTPLCVTSSLSILNALEIPLSDVKEVEVHIGSEEEEAGRQPSFWKQLRLKTYGFGMHFLELQVQEMISMSLSNLLFLMIFWKGVHRMLVILLTATSIIWDITSLMVYILSGQLSSNRSILHKSGSIGYLQNIKRLPERMLNEHLEFYKLVLLL